MGIKRIQNVYYASTDMAKAAPFYEGLGMTTKFADGEKWLQLSANGQNFALSSPEEAGGATAGGVVVLEVDDLAESEAAVVAHGGAIVSRRDMSDHGRTVTVTDPSGNRLQLFAR